MSTRCRRPSVDERLRCEIADQRTVVAGLQRRCLHHQYGYQLFLGINPKRGAPYASPEVFSWRSWHRVAPFLRADDKPESKTLAYLGRRRDPKRLKKVQGNRTKCNAGPQMIGCHERNGSR